MTAAQKWKQTTQQHNNKEQTIMNANMKGGHAIASNDLEHSRRLSRTVMVLLCLSAALVYLTSSQVAQAETALRSSKDTLTHDGRHAVEMGATGGSCAEFCPLRQDAVKKQFANTANLLDLDVVLQSVKQAQNRMKDKLKVEYGATNFHNMFEAISSKWKQYGLFRPVPETSSTSMDRAKLKMKIKILTMQKEYAEKQSIIHGCNCLDGNTGTPKVNKETFTTVESDAFTPFIWMTGGHSASAGHGNLFNESYTAIMENTAKDVFSAAGMGFEGKNYAMGGTSSGPEISFCNQAIFGLDYDVLSWDYGMTDGRGYDKLKTYLYRAGGMIPSHPIIIGIEIGGHRPRVDAFQEMGEMGLASFVPDDVGFKDLKAAIPETEGMSLEDREKMPPLVQNFKCSGGIEKGEPDCQKDKFSKFVCAGRKGQTSWHPGTKFHALQGTRMALFVTQILVDSLTELKDEKGDKEVATMLRDLQNEQKGHIDEFKAKDIPPMGRWKDEAVEGLDMDHLLRTPGICKTGRTPSFTRYQGILTESNQVGSFAPPGEETYDVGIKQEEAESTPANNLMRLTYGRGQETCHTIVRPDYKDYFYMGARDGWSKLIFPNAREKKAFAYDKTNMKGHVIVCPGVCDWGKCKPGDTKISDTEGLENKVFEIKVNGAAVTGMSGIDECVLLLGKNGPTFEQTKDGTYEVEVKINDATNQKYMRISTIAVF